MTLVSLFGQSMLVAGKRQAVRAENTGLSWHRADFVPVDASFPLFSSFEHNH
jgi:hypothetical protein